MRRSGLGDGLIAPEAIAIQHNATEAQDKDDGGVDNEGDTQLP